MRRSLQVIRICLYCLFQVPVEHRANMLPPYSLTFWYWWPVQRCDWPRLIRLWLKLIVLPKNLYILILGVCTYKKTKWMPVSNRDLKDQRFWRKGKKESHIPHWRVHIPRISTPWISVTACLLSHQESAPSLDQELQTCPTVWDLSQTILTCRTTTQTWPMLCSWDI